MYSGRGHNVAFATILAVVSGLVLAASSAFSHDIYSSILKKGKATEAQQMLAAKYSAVIVGVLSIMLALGAQKLNVAFLVSLAFAVAASANLPVLLLTLYWRKFNSAGAVCGLLTGLLSSILFVVLSPNVMDPSSGWIRMNAVFPLNNPGIVCIPLGFLGGVLGSLLASKRKHPDSYDKMLIRAHLAASEFEREEK
jgi:cation/acetate symporter